MENWQLFEQLLHVQQLCVLVQQHRHAWNGLLRNIDNKLKTNYPQSTSQLWFQLYVYQNRQYSQKLIERAERCGYKALVLTVDHCVLGNRECDVHNNFTLPDGIQAENLIDDDQVMILPKLIVEHQLMQHYRGKILIGYDRSHHYPSFLKVLFIRMMLVKLLDMVYKELLFRIMVDDNWIHVKIQLMLYQIS